MSFNFGNIDAVKKVMGALQHKNRQRILLFILKHPNCKVKQIYDHFAVSQSIASQQLAILREAGIVQYQRDGKNILYNVDMELLQSIEEYCGCLLKITGLVPGTAIVNHV
jgi:DNA-binding transcriptional ArsR family regulator